ncbi:glycosyltransferase 87 family protein [Actinacidiphila yeochonensis]|uniref:glycosyltransferase 87 family protein n=1 Tax=Actinacidiphila yeochonensis TaxID=89050 RepID=UPI000691DE9A|nr:glycosyltransferase 87 family protein [Actinacidiphila yeochonensis]
MSRRLRTGCALGVCAASLVLVWIVQRVTHVSLVDVMVYRAAGQTVRDDGDLYAMRATSARLPMTYPPFAGLLFVPLTWLDTAAMRTAVTAANLLLAIVVAGLSLRLVLPRRPDAALVLGTAAWAVWSEPVFSTVRYGQVNLLLAALVLWDFTRSPGNRWSGVGTGLAAAIKITPLLFLAVMAVAAIATRGRGTPWPRRFLTALAAFAGATLIAVALLPHDSKTYWTRDAFAPNRSGSAVNVANQSLRGIVARLQHTQTPSSMWVVAAVLVAIGGTAIAAAALTAPARLRSSAAWATVTCAVTALLVSPITWTHHWVWDVPMAVLLVHEAFRRRDPRWTAGAAACVVAFSTAAPWTVPHGPGRPELHENPAQMVVAAIYPLAGIAFLATAAVVTLRARAANPTPAAEHGTAAP